MYFKLNKQKILISSQRISSHISHSEENLCPKNRQLIIFISHSIYVQIRRMRSQCQSIFCKESIEISHIIQFEVIESRNGEKQ